jgi:hypothetical protein
MPRRGSAAAPRRARVPGSRSPLRARRRIIGRAACTGPRGSGVGQSVRGGRLTTGGSRCNGCVYMGGRRRRREIAGWGHSRISPSDARAPARSQPVPVHADGGPAVIRAIFDARDRPEAERPGQLGKEYQEKTPRLAEWQEANGPESLKISSLPVGHRWQLRTSNLMERLNEGIKRRTRVPDLFPKEASALRPVVTRSPTSLHRAAEQRIDSRSCRPYPALTI